MNDKKAKKAVLQLLSQEGARAMTKSELARELAIPSKDRGNFRKILAAMMEDGTLKMGKKARLEIPGKGEERDSAGRKGFVVGRIRIFPKGHASVYPEEAHEANKASGFDLAAIGPIRVSSGRTRDALDGDTVEVRASLRRGRFGDVEAQGEVTEILKRSDRLVVGTYFERSKFIYVQPDAEYLPQTLTVDACLAAKTGMKVAVKVTEWRSGEDPHGIVEEVIGFADEPGADLLSVVHKYGLQTEFSENLLKDADEVASEPSAKELAAREDWTDRLVITIDPADAKDHDDAIWVKALNGGGWQLAVHIADVSHYVKPGSALDKEALKRGNSTYLVDRVLPMLPETLSNGICSLKPYELRLTKAVFMEISATGKVVKSRFIAGYINSQAKLAYEEAQDILDKGKAPDRFSGSIKVELESMVKEAWKMASVLRQRRFKEGALDMEMDEIKVLVDKDTKEATGYQKVEHCESHQLIEECMLLANEAVARKLRGQQKPAIYRVHDDPDPEKLAEFAEMARVYGFEVGDLTNRKHVQSIIDQAIGSPSEYNVKLGLLKSLRRAEYSDEPLGHFGLNKPDYAHFTSPIRRYADLVVHRALQHLLENRPKNPDRSLSQQQCKEAAVHISDTERNSSFAEQETKTLKLLEWLEVTRKLKEAPHFEGVVTSVRSRGVFVEATDIMQKGLVKFEDLPGKGWDFDRSGPSYVRKGEQVEVGTHVVLKVAKVDFIEQRVDFSVAEVKKTRGIVHQASKSRPKKKGGKKPAKKNKFSKGKKFEKADKKPSRKSAKGPRSASPKKKATKKRSRKKS